jgi:hypothetical protein
MELSEKNGTFSPICAPLGYRLKNKTLVIEESEVEIIKDVFQQYVNGCGIRAEDTSILDYMINAVKFFCTTQQEFRWQIGEDNGRKEK